MEQSIFTVLFLPLALGVIMLGMGMTLTLDDFRRVVVYPKAVVTGLSCQLILLPMIGFTIAWLMPMAPELAVGIILISLCPGGATSNIISHLARADLALSVTLTAISSVVITFTIPFFLNLALYHYMGGEEAIQLPLGETILQIFLVTLFPVSIGMLIKKHCPDFTQRSLRSVSALSASFFVIILGMAVFREREHLPAYFQEAGLAALALNLSAMCLGFGIGKLLSLEYRQRASISIETGIQNGTLAIAIALSPVILDNSRIATPAVIYSLIMFVTAGCSIFLFRRWGKQEARSADVAALKG